MADPSTQQNGRVPVVPHLITREIACALAVCTVLGVVSTLFDAPLLDMADPELTPVPAKAPWYFLWLQELLHIAPPLVGGVLIPLAALGFLVALPYLDRAPRGVAGARRMWVSLFALLLSAVVALTLIGVFFRGPNWRWTWPWIEGIY